MGIIKAKSRIKYRDLTFAESPLPYSNKPPIVGKRCMLASTESAADFFQGMCE